MSKYFSHIISWGSLLIIAVTVIALLTFIIKLSWFSELAISGIALPIQWATVEGWQWYLLWFSTAVYLSIGLLGLYFLHLTFKNISKGEFFNLTNSLNIKRFSIFLFMQAAAKPIHLSLASLYLSFNHPEGEKVFALVFGSQEVFVLSLAMILWVISDVLVAGCKLQSENRQFV